MTPIQLTPHQRMQIAVRARRALITIERVYKGCVATTTTRAAVEDAARELGLPPPPAAPQSIRAARCA